MPMTWGQFGLTHTKTVWCVLWSSNQNFEITETDQLKCYEHNKYLPWCGAGWSCRDSVGVLVHIHLQSHGLSNFCQINFIFHTLNFEILFHVQYSCKLWIPEYISMVEGAADTQICGHWCEDPGTVHLFSIQETLLQEIIWAGVVVFVGTRQVGVP